MSIEELSTALTTLPSAVVGHRDMVRAIRCWVQHDSETRKCHASQVRILNGIIYFLPAKIVFLNKNSNKLVDFDCFGSLLKNYEWLWSLF